MFFIIVFKDDKGNDIFVNNLFSPPNLFPIFIRKNPFFLPS